MKIVKVEKLPSTCNAWGFCGAINKVKYIMENSDVWVSGTAMYRHMDDYRYLQAVFSKGSKVDFNGGACNDYDVKRIGKAEKQIEKYYAKLAK